MKLSKLVERVEAEVERELEESQNQRDARVEHLWRLLDPQGAGELDFKGLQKALRKIDHRKSILYTITREYMHYLTSGSTQR